MTRPPVECSICKRTISYANIARHQRKRHGLETRQGIRVTIPEEFLQEVRITRATQSQTRQRIPIERRRSAPRRRVYNPLADLTQDIRDRSDVLPDRRRRQNRLIWQGEALEYNRVLRRN